MSYFQHTHPSSPSRRGVGGGGTGGAGAGGAHRPSSSSSSSSSPSSPSSSNPNPNEGPSPSSHANLSPVDHPDDEVEQPPPIHRSVGSSYASSSSSSSHYHPRGGHHSHHSHHSHQSQQHQQHQQHAPHVSSHHSSAPHPSSPAGSPVPPSSLASKPHAFHGAVLSPEHARNLTPDLALQLASALSVQASHAAQGRGILPPGEGGNLFEGSGLADLLTGGGGGGGGGGGADGSAGVFRAGGLGTPSSTLSNAGAPSSTVANASLPGNSGAGPSATIVNLLQRGHAPPTPSRGPPSSTGLATPGVSTPGVPSSTLASPAESAAAATAANNTSHSSAASHPGGGLVDPLSLLSSAEALESYAGWRTHYTVWIAESWNVLRWSEPSAALFWEMATMFHTLYVAGLSVRGGGSGAAVRGRVLGIAGDAVDEAAGGAPVGRRGSDAPSHDKEKESANAAAAAAFRAATGGGATASQGAGGASGGGGSGNYIPPLLSCGSQSSMGSVRSGGMSVSDVGAGAAHGGSHGGGGAGGSGSGSGSGGGTQHPAAPSFRPGSIKPARHSARELPVWLISMFLLAHCEPEAHARCTSGDDERRFSDAASGRASPLSAGSFQGSDGDSLDFTALLHHRSLSPRTRLHAGTHRDNANCAAFLLRHLRKFLLLSAVPRNAAACRACAVLAMRAGGNRAPHTPRSPKRRNSTGGGSDLEPSRIGTDHAREHGDVGVDVEVTVEELDRLNLVLQAPGGGLVDDPPVAAGEHVLARLAEEELDAARARGQTKPTSRKWERMQDGWILVGDAERVLCRHLEEEIALAKQESEAEGGEEGGEDVASRLSRLSLGSGPLSPPRSRGAAATDAKGAGEVAEHDAAGAGGYLKELSYQKLRSTTVLLEPGVEGGGGHGSSAGAADGASSVDGRSQASRGSSSGGGQGHSAGHVESGRLHDLHVADCSDVHFYLLQPFEHATIAACTDCTIVLGAVAGLLHVVDCERTTITAAARRVAVSNSSDVVHHLFTPSPPLLVGDNRGCQFAPYNTHYEGLREDLLSTGLAAVIRSAGGRDAASVVDGGTAASPGRTGGSGGHDGGGGLPTLQCASNKWKVPVELNKLEVPQLPNVQTPGSPGGLDSPTGSLSPGADDRALGGSVDVSMKTPVLLPPSEFDVLLVPVESEEARVQRRLQRESQAEAAMAAAGSTDEDAAPHAPEAGGNDDAGEAATVHSATSSLTGFTGDKAGKPPPPESDYCRILADLLSLSPFHMPHDYERRVIAKAERVRTIQQVILQELNDEQRANLEEEINRGFQDWLVASGNLRQVLDLIHLEKSVSAA
ncbi:hypothetical protein ACHAWF_010276 [Thalassiosira exigua]